MTWSWRVLIAVLASMVLLVGLGRLLFSSLPIWQPELAHMLSTRLHADLQVESMSAHWNDGMPLLSLRGLSLKGSDASVTGFSISQLNVALNLRKSLLNWTPVFTSLTLNGVNIELVQRDGASWTLAGIDQIAGSSLPDREHQKGALLSWLALQQSVDINDIRLRFGKIDGSSSEINGRSLKVLTEGDQKALSARLEVGSGYVSLQGRGVISQETFFGWQGRIQANNLDVEQLCVLWGGCRDNIRAVRVQLDSQWRYDRNHWQVAGQVALPSVVYLDHTGLEQQISAQTDLFMQGALGVEPDLQVWLNNLTLANHLHDGTTSYWHNSWYLAGDQKSGLALTIATDALDLDASKRWLLDSGLLPGKVAALVRTLNPRGQLNELALRLFPSRKPFDIDLSAELDNVSVAAWRGAPLGGNVSGPLRMSLLQGYLDLDSRDFQLGFPKLFRETWTFNSATGRLYWDVIDGFYILRSDNLALTGAEGDLKGKLRLDIPLHWHPDETLDMALTVGLSHGDARFTSKYLPALLPLSPALTHWLDTAIRQADITGGFIYNGVLNSDSPVMAEDSRWGLFFDVSNGELDYALDWPEITDLNAQVLVNDDRVEVLGQSARSVGADLSHITARVPLKGESVVSVATQLRAGGDTLQHFLTRTPINSWLNGAAQSWQLTGKPGSLVGSLDLALPLDDLERSKVDIRSNVQSFRFAIPDKGIDINTINGDLSYSSDKGLVGRQLSGTMFGHTSQFTIRSPVVNHEPVSTDIDWAGRISMATLQGWLKYDWLNVLRGETDYQGSLSIGLKNQATLLRISSELLGIATDLPAPLNKTSERPQKLDLTLRQTQKDGLLTVKLAELGELAMGLTTEFAPSSARITLGAESANAQNLPGKGGVVVSGFLPRLDIDPWQAFFQQHSNLSLDQQAQAAWPKIDNVRVGSLHWGQYRWPDISVWLQPALRLGESGEHHQGVSLQVNSDAVQGRLWYPSQQSAPWLLTIDHAHLPEAASPVKDKASHLASVNPQTFPDIDVQVKKLQLGQQPPFDIAFDLRQAPDGVRIDNLSGDLAGMQLTGEADWVQVEGEQRSWLQSRVYGPDISQLLPRFKLDGILQARESDITSSLNWLGPPYDVDVASLKGRVDLSLKKGALHLSDRGSSEALKLFGIFNIESLARRITLDFSDLFSSGVSFDRLQASLAFNRGVVTFDEPMIIEGPSSDFKLDGTINLNHQQLDLSLVVTFPLTSNLPILSVLLGTAPQVAGMIYIADKLLGKQVAQLTSIRYRIRGSFADPKMTLDKLFTNQPTKGRHHSAE